VAFDARGHGDSGWDPDGLYTQDARVADLRAILKAEQAAEPVLIGASMGGVTALIAAGESLIDIGALVLVDIAPQIEGDGVARIRSFMDANPEGFGSLDEVANAIARYQPHRPRPKTLSGLSKNVRLHGDGRYHWHWDPKSRARDVDPIQRQKRLEACARHLKIPTLLVRGGLSDLVSEEGASAFLALCPSAEYVNVAGAAHMVAGDRNDVFADAAAEFLLRVAPPIRDQQHR
jgi:non-heme chloroperoxidase